MGREGKGREGENKQAGAYNILTPNPSFVSSNLLHTVAHAIGKK